MFCASWVAQLRKGRDGERLETGLQRGLPVRGIVGRMRAWNIPFFLLIKLRISDAKKVIARRHPCPTGSVSVERKIFTGGHRGDLFHAVCSKVLGERGRDLSGWFSIVISRLGGFHNGDLGGAWVRWTPPLPPAPCG